MRDESPVRTSYIRIGRKPYPNEVLHPKAQHGRQNISATGLLNFVLISAALGIAHAGMVLLSLARDFCRTYGAFHNGGHHR